MSQKTIQLTFFIGLTLGLLVLSFLVLKPYLDVIFLSVVLAVVFYPLYQKFLTKWRGRRPWAAFSAVLTIFVCILVPALLLSVSLLREAVSLYNTLAFGGADQLIAETNNLLSRLSSFFPSEDMSPYLAIDNYARDLLNWIIGHFDSVFSAVFGGVFDFVLMLLTLYYFFIFGDQIKRNLVTWSPLPDQYDEGLMAVLASSFEAVMRGRLVVSVAQGLFLGLGFLIFGISNPVLWGFVGGFASLVPIVGTALISIPAVFYLLVSGHTLAAIGFFVWSAICVGLIDNVLSFFFLKDKINLHPLIVLFAILGGVELFGAIGFLIGPVVLSMFFALLRIYPIILSYKSEQP